MLSKSTDAMKKLKTIQLTTTITTTNYIAIISLKKTISFCTALTSLLPQDKILEYFPPLESAMEIVNTRMIRIKMPTTMLSIITTHTNKNNNNKNNNHNVKVYHVSLEWFTPKI